MACPREVGTVLLASSLPEGADTEGAVTEEELDEAAWEKLNPVGAAGWLLLGANTNGLLADVATGAAV